MTSTSRLLELPSEIRASILLEIFKGGTVEILLRFDRYKGILGFTRNYDIGLLLACSQLHAEGSAILASCLHLHFRHFTSPRSLTDAARSRYLPDIQHVTIHRTSTPKFEYKEFSALRTLSLEGYLYDVLAEVDSMEHWKRVYLGDIDDELVARSRGLYVDEPDLATFRNFEKRVYNDEQRNFKIHAGCHVVASSADVTMIFLEETGRRKCFELEYDMDTLEIIGRKDCDPDHWL